MDAVIIDKPEVQVHYFQKASLLLRIKSMIIDTVVIIALMTLAFMLLHQIGTSMGPVRGIAFMLILLYEPILLTLDRTLGQKLMGLRVCRFSSLAENEKRQNINFLASLFRYVLKVLLGWVSLLTVHSDPYGQAIHDKAANSVMVVE